MLQKPKFKMNQQTDYLIMCIFSFNNIIMFFKCDYFSGVFGEKILIANYYSAGQDAGAELNLDEFR